MIINSKETTIAYRCPVCGKFILGIVGIFTLSGDLIKVKCDCGGSELTVSVTSDKKLRITVPCLFCPAPHSYIISTDGFFEKDLLALSCTYSSLDVCFIGEKEKVLAAARQADEELLTMLEDAGFSGFEEFMNGRNAVTDNSEDNVDDEYRMDYAQIEDIVRFMLVELAEDGDISCGCKEGDTARYDFEFVGDSVRIFCHTCGNEAIVPMSSTLAANAFLHADSLELKKPE